MCLASSAGYIGVGPVGTEVGSPVGPFSELSEKRMKDPVDGILKVVGISAPDATATVRPSTRRVPTRRPRPGTSRRLLRIALAVAAVPVMVGITLPEASIAGATSFTTIDARADSTGPIVVDSAGNGYVAWATTVGNANGDPLLFCKIPKGGTCTDPQLLPIPSVDHWDDYQVIQPFPVIGGKAGVVSVVGPSYDYGDVVVWTSTNSGATFGEPQVITSATYDGTTVGDVLRTADADTPYYPDYFVTASTNPGLFYDFTGIGAIGALDPPAGFAQNTSSVAGAVNATSLGYGATIDPGPSQSTQTVEAFSTDADSPQLDYFWSPVPGVSGIPGPLEHGPNNVTVGTNPRLAGGPDGLYLLSEDSGATSSDPLKLDVRVWDSTRETFGSPTFVALVPNDINATNEGGFTEDSSTGALSVAWPMETADGSYVMDTWTSTDNGATFSGATTVAPIAASYLGPSRLAMVGGKGFLTWQDSSGLELVDLPAVPAVTSGPYSPLTPVRICDTRSGNPSNLNGTAAQCNGLTIGAGKTLTIAVAGHFSVPATANAVVLNVGAVNPSGQGYLSVFPSGSAKPSTSNMNYQAGHVVDNLIEVGAGTSGEVSLFSSTPTNVVVDLEGYVAPTAAGGSGAGLFEPLSSPARLCDTRAGNPSGLMGGDAQCNGAGSAGKRLSAGGSITITVATNNAIPAGATAAVLNLTAVNSAGPGYLTVYPQGATLPVTANVNYSAGAVQSNRAIVPLPTNGNVTVYSSAATDVLVDVSGYYTAAGGVGSQFTAEPAPIRICDTRANNPSGLSGAAGQCENKTLGALGTDTVQVTGLANVPTWASAVVVNLTAIGATAHTFLAVFPGTNRPDVSDVNPGVGSVVATLTVSALSASGTISVFNESGSVNVAVDVLGWYS